MIRSVLIVGCLLAASAVRAQVSDIARLFPAGTLAYAELHDPAKLGPEFAAIVKGSALEDSFRLVHERRDKTKNMRDLLATDEFAILGLLVSPEMIGEFRKVHGAAVAITGFNERHRPDYAFALLTGDSQALGLAIRAYLTVNPSARKIGIAAGVPVFQIRAASVQYGNNGQPLPANEKPLEESLDQPTFAYTPGLLVVGNSRAVVGEVLSRFQDPSQKSLADLPAFQEAAKMRRPGLFGFALPGELCGKLDAANKQTGQLIDDDAFALLKMVANVKAIRSASASVHFRDKGLACQADLHLEPGTTSPLMSLLEGPAFDSTVLGHLPGGTAFAISVALPVEKRAESVLNLLDAIAKANGALGRLPSQAVVEIASKSKLDLARDVLAKTSSISLVVPTRQELPQGVVAWPTFLLHGDTGTPWAEGLQAVVADLSGSSARPQPSSEMVEGVKVFSLPATNLPWKAPVHYASSAGVFVISLDRRVVASSLSGTTAIPKLPAGKDAKPTAACVLSAGGLLHLALTLPKSRASEEGPSVIEEGPRPIGLGKRQLRNPNGQPIDPELIKGEARAFDEMLVALSALPPATGTVSRGAQIVRFEGFFPEIQGPTMAKALDQVFLWLDRLVAASGRDSNDRQGIILPQ